MSAPRELTIWTVYTSPKDYPGLFVARKSVVGKQGVVLPLGEMFTAETLEEVRQLLPDGLYRINRLPEDDPVIVEVWL